MPHSFGQNQYQGEIISKNGAKLWKFQKLTSLNLFVLLLNDPDNANSKILFILQLFSVYFCAYNSSPECSHENIASRIYLFYGVEIKK